jgi:alkanesulfonate monooxygenase SsuD/methylene tetrahydromethanopterin reductase-like flavin-dependent oxidoreductase (luciferase family)
MSYGVMLPHFGEHASRKSVVDGARAAEDLGFDSVWFRDHVVYRTHPWESADLTFVDPFIAMSAAAGATRRIAFGTGTLIPHRHPIHLALLIGSLDLLAGPDRLLIGMGLGASDAEFEAVGMGGWDRREVWAEQMDILRLLFTGAKISHEGRYYRFDNVEIHPVPRDGSVELWYGGPSDAAVRRAAERCEGWGPVIMPRRDLAVKVKLLARLAGRSGRAVPAVAVRSEVSPGRTVEDGARYIKLAPHLANAAKSYASPTGSFESIADLDGMVIAGPAELIIEEIRKYEALGAAHFIFDLRARSAEWRACLDEIGTGVLPALRRTS